MVARDARSGHSADEDLVEDDVQLLVQNSNSSPSSSSELDDMRDRFFTVDEALDAVGFGRFQFYLLVYTGFAWASDALEMMLLSYLGPAARCHFGLSTYQESCITSVVFVGMMFGSYTWGMIADIKGRRLGFLSTALTTCIAGVLSALAPTYTVLLLCRMLVGFGLGGVPVAFNLFMEFVPTNGRGHWLVLIESFWSIGAVAEAGLAWAVLEPLGCPSSSGVRGQAATVHSSRAEGARAPPAAATVHSSRAEGARAPPAVCEARPPRRWLVGLSATPLILLMLLFPFLPESPHFLLVQGDKEGATRTLERVLPDPISSL
ncbi:hypothetical protein CYMTET_46119 [Cymbomonas tetramitiformis]|uniref:Major facilitator superfamily (MFS) profile domain-containing protein n=1 Tax=Cymbomonas tetramitiformis TaxID=36881 RepID=A0AAE0BWU6_9CHLO|nr:hypothetical protein CYMTET_46119 [Cymbomonas tetramitiformis]